MKKYKLICPKCNGEIRPAGFSGKFFCWGKCYHYLTEQEIKKAREFNDIPTNPWANPETKKLNDSSKAITS